MGLHNRRHPNKWLQMGMEILDRTVWLKHSGVLLSETLLTSKSIAWSGHTDFELNNDATHAAEAEG